MRVAEKWFCKLGFFFRLDKIGSANSIFFFFLETQKKVTFVSGLRKVVLQIRILILPNHFSATLKVTYKGAGREAD